MKKIKVLYVFGYGNFPDTCQANDLQIVLGKQYEVVCDYYAQYNPKEALTDINAYIEKHNIDILVGEDIGGYILTLMDNDLPKILINPCFDIIKTLKEYEAPNHIIEFYEDYVKKPVYNDKIHCTFFEVKDYAEYKKVIDDCTIITHIDDVAEKIKSL